MISALKQAVLPMIGFLAAFSACRVEAGLTPISVATGAGEVSLITPQEGAVGSTAFNLGGNVYNSPTDSSIVKNSTTTTPTGLLDELYGRGNYSRVSDQADQLWTHGADGTSSVTLKLRYAGLQYQLGIDPNPQATASTLAKDFTPLATVIGIGFGARFSSINSSFAQVVSTDEIKIFRTGSTIEGKSYQGLPDPFAWLLKAPVAGSHQTSDIWSTLVSQNSDGLDHVVTYKVGSGAQTRYVLAFDDQRGGGDCAYNDAIFEVTSSLLPAPEPSTLVIGGVSLIGTDRLPFRPAQERPLPLYLSADSFLMPKQRARATEHLKTEPQRSQRTQR